MGGDKAAWGREVVRKGLTTFTAQMGDSHGKYCMGDEVTLADAFLIPQLLNAERFGLDVTTDFPVIAGIKENLDQLPEFVKAHADNQADAVK